jgi:hypothetical protein
VEKKVAPGGLIAVIVLLFLFSSLFHGPVEPNQSEGIRHLRVGSAIFARPMVISGDSPHYLVLVHSLIEDGDFDLSNNYAQARAGDWDTGARFRNFDLDHHTCVDIYGQEFLTHPPFLPMLLAPFALPFRGTQWVEPVCIWLTLLAGFLGILYFMLKSGFPMQWAVLLAIATPLWCYSRDLWTEPWIAAIWAGMLFSGSPVVLAALAFSGTLIKYPFVVVPVVMGLVTFWKGQRKQAYALLAGGVIGILAAIALVQYLFSDVNHFNLLHMGGHYKGSTPSSPLQAIAPYRLSPLRGTLGLLFDAKDGILVFFPFLAWGLWEFRKGGRTYLPAIAFFLVHALYPGWTAGAGFSARYLVPMMPVMVLAVAVRKPSGWPFQAAVLYSLGWGLLAGIYPALAYNRSPLDVAAHVWGHVSRLLGG